VTTKELKDNLDNRLWRLNNLYWIMDDQGNKIRFHLNAVQYALYMAMWWLNIILKSRQHGITTFICIFFLDACLFNENVRAGIIAHRLEDAKKIFRDKVKYAYDRLPKSIKQTIYQTKDSVEELLLSNNSSIYVSTSMRSGTLQYLHISEYGYVCAHAPEKAKEIKDGATETVHENGFIFIESTAEGMGNDFHSLCKTAEGLKKSGQKLSKLDYKFHFFAWHEKPDNVIEPEDIAITPKMNEYFNVLEVIYKKEITPEQRAWYVVKKRTLGTDMYKEHPSTADEAFRASMEGTYLGKEMALAEEQGRITFVPHDPSAKVFTFWDTGNIYTSLWFVQFKGEKINCIEHYYDDLGQGLPHFAKLLQDRPYVYGEHWAGPDLEPKHGSNSKSFQTGETTIHEAKRLGIDLRTVEPHSFDDRIRSIKNIMPKVFFDKEKCETGYVGLMKFRRRKNTQLSTDDRPVFFEEPVRDTIDIHIADSFGHMAVKYYTLYVQGIRVGDHIQRITMPRKSPYSNNVLSRGFRKRKGA